MSQQSGTRTVLNWILPGLIAGLVFAMWAMVVGLFTSTLSAPPQGIGQSIGIGSAGHNFQLVPLVVGLMGHMMNSIVLGVIFIAVANATRLRGPAVVVGGMVYGVVVYVAMYWVLLRGILSSTSGSFLSANPEWSDRGSPDVRSRARRPRCLRATPHAPRSVSAAGPGRVAPPSLPGGIGPKPVPSACSARL